jgi:hypothetical protein
LGITVTASNRRTIIIDENPAANAMILFEKKKIIIKKIARINTILRAKNRPEVFRAFLFSFSKTRDNV